MKALVTIMDIIETLTIVDIGPRLRGNNTLGSLRRQVAGLTMSKGIPA
jgi:hypothetical protein